MGRVGGIVPIQANTSLLKGALWFTLLLNFTEQAPDPLDHFHGGAY